MDSWKLKFGRGGPPESRPVSSSRVGAALERWLRPPKLSWGSMAVVVAVSDQSFDHAVFMSILSPEASIMEASGMELLELPAISSAAYRYRHTHVSLQQSCNAGDSGSAWHASALEGAADDDDDDDEMAKQLRSDGGASASTSYSSGTPSSLEAGSWGGHASNISGGGSRGSSAAWDDLDEQRRHVSPGSEPLLREHQHQHQHQPQQQTELSLAARKLLTAAIMGCTDWQQLASVIKQHVGRLDAIHLSAALVKAAKMGGDGAVSSFPEQLAQGSSDSSSRGEGGGGGGIAVLGRLVDPGFCSLVEGLCGRLSRSVHLLVPRQVSNALWALSTLVPALSRSAAAAAAAAARRREEPKGADGERDVDLGIDPDVAPPRCPAGSAARACQQAARRLALGMQPLLVLQLRPAAAAAAVGKVPAGGGSSSSRGNVHDGSSEASCSPQALANSIWAMARLGLRPNDAWLSSFLSLSAGLLSSGGFRPRELSMTLWALATLRLWPGERWVGAVSDCILSGLRRTGGLTQAEGHDSAGGSGEEYGPDAECYDAGGGGEEFGPQALANTLWAIARLRIPVPESVLAELRGACLLQLPAFSSEQLSATLWALATMGTPQCCNGLVGLTAQPPPHQRLPLLPPPLPPLPLPSSAAGHARTAECAGAAPEHGLLPPPRASPPPPRLVLVKDGTLSASHPPAAASAPSLSLAGSSVPAPVAPCSREGLVSALVACLHERMEGLQPRGLANAAWALARLDHRPTAAWTAKFLAAVGQRAGGLSTAGLCQLLWALNRWGARPSQPWTHTVSQSALAAGLPAGMSPAQADVVLQSLAGMGLRPSAGFLHVLVATTGRSLEARRGDCSAATAARLCGALGALRVWPGRAWMRGAYGAVMRGREGLGPELVSAMLCGVAGMPADASGNNVDGGATAAAAGSDDGSLSDSGTSSSGGISRVRTGVQQSAVSSSAEGGSGTEVLPPRLPRRLMQLLLVQLLRDSGNGHVNHVADATWAAVRLGCRPPSVWVRALLRLTCSPQAVRQLSAGSAVRLLCACAALGARPPSPDAARLVSEQLVHKASALLPEELRLLSTLLAGRIACQPVVLPPPSAVATSSVDESSRRPMEAPPPQPSSVDEYSRRPLEAPPPQPSEVCSPPSDGYSLLPDAAARSRHWADGARTAFVSGLFRVPAQQLVSLATMRVGIPLSEHGSADGGDLLGARWGAAVEEASLLKLSPAAAPTYGGMSAATRTSLLGCLLRSRRRPSQAWLEAWCTAVAAGARRLSPAQALTAVRLLASASPAASSSDQGTPPPPPGSGQSLLLRAIESSAVLIPDAAAADSQEGAAAVAAAWGPTRLAALSAHLHMMGLAPSPQLEAALGHTLALLAQSSPTMPSAAQASRGSSSSSTKLNTARGRKGSDAKLLVGAASSPTVASTRSLVAGLLELSPLARRRSGSAAVRAVELVMVHLHSLPPELLLDAVSPATKGTASSDAATAAPPGVVAEKADPLSPFYTAMAIDGPSGSRPSASTSAAAGGGMLCSLLEMMARWGCPPPPSSSSSRAWLPGVISGAVSRSLVVGVGDGVCALPLVGTHLFSLLRSVALLQVAVPERCISGLLSALTPSRLRELGAKPAAEVAWALGVLQHRPDTAWWRAYESVLLSAAASPETGGASRAAGDMTVASSSPAVTSVPSAAGCLLDSMPGKQLCEVAWACATLGLSPSPTLLSGLAAAAVREMPSLAPASLSNLLWSLTALDPRGEGFMEASARPAPSPPVPPHRLLRTSSFSAHRKSFSMATTPRPSTAVAVPGGSSGGSGAGGPPSWRTWMDLWLSEAAGKMAGFGPQDLAMVASALAASRCKPRQEWLARYLAQALAKADECRGPQLARIVCGLAELDCHPSPEWVAAFAERADHPSVASELDAASLNQLAWAIGRLSPGGGGQGDAAVLVALSSSSSSSSGILSNVVGSDDSGGLGLQPAGDGSSSRRLSLGRRGSSSSRRSKATAA